MEQQWRQYQKRDECNIQSNGAEPSNTDRQNNTQKIRLQKQILSCSPGFYVYTTADTLMYRYNRVQTWRKRTGKASAQMTVRYVGLLPDSLKEHPGFYEEQGLLSLRKYRRRHNAGKLQRPLCIEKAWWQMWFRASITDLDEQKCKAKGPTDKKKKERTLNEEYLTGHNRIFRPVRVPLFSGILKTSLSLRPWNRSRLFAFLEKLKGLKLNISANKILQACIVEFLNQTNGVSLESRKLARRYNKRLSRKVIVSHQSDGTNYPKDAFL